MSPPPARKPSEAARAPKAEQISAGGVAFRRGRSGPEVVLISVGPAKRWQLPKGHIDTGETPEEAALREVREEAGIETRLVSPIDVIEYWFVGTDRGEPVRFHKRVHFFLLAYRRGDVRRHDKEVNEARWFPLSEAKELLAFKGEREVMAKAARLIERLDR